MVPAVINDRHTKYPEYVVHKQASHYHSEESKDKFVEHLHTESHAIVFDKEQTEPIGNNQFLTIVETGFHPYLKNLVGTDNQ